MPDGALLAWAFGAGVIAAVNPCGFALLPGFVARFLGPTQAESRLRGTAYGIAVGGTFVAGKLVVFAAVAAVFLAGGRAVVGLAPWAGAVIGGVLVLFGVWTLAGQSVSLPLPALRAPRGSGLRQAWGLGALYGTCSLACCLPIFLGVFVGLGGGMAASVATSSLLFGTYALGVALVLLPLFALTGAAREALVARLRRLSRLAHPAAGVLLTAAGVVLVATWVPVLAGDGTASPLVSAVFRWQEWAQRLVARLRPEFWATLAVALTALVLYPIVRRWRAVSASRSDEPGAGSQPLEVRQPEEVDRHPDQQHAHSPPQHP